MAAEIPDAEPEASRRRRRRRGRRPPPGAGSRGGDDGVVTRRSAGPDRRGQPVLDPAEDPADRAAGRRPGLAGRIPGSRPPPAVTLSASGIGERSGVPARGSGGLTGTSLRCCVVADTSVASNAIAPSLPAPVGRDEPVMEVLHRRLRMEGDHRVLELVGAEPADEVRRGEDERIADRDLAPPDVRLELGGRQAALAVRIGQRRQPGLADEVGLGRTDGHDVQLVAPDDGRRRRRSVRCVVPSPPSRSRWCAELLVGGLDRLLEADDDAGRLVVVVLAPDRSRRPAGSPRAAARPARPGGHEQVQAALRARRSSRSSAPRTTIVSGESGRRSARRRSRASSGAVRPCGPRRDQAG